MTYLSELIDGELEINNDNIGWRCYFRYKEYNSEYTIIFKGKCNILKIAELCLKEESDNEYNITCFKIEEWKREDNKNG